MNQRTASRSERLHFEEQIQNDKRTKHQQNTPQEKSEYTPLPTQHKNTENRVRFADNLPNNKQQAPKRSFTKRDAIWEEKKQKKLSGIQNRVNINNNLVSEYMNNIHKNFTRQVYNTGTPRVDPNINKQQSFDEYGKGNSGNNYQQVSSTQSNNYAQNVMPQSGRSTPFTYNNRFQQTPNNNPNTHIIQGGVQSNNYPHPNRSTIPTPNPHVLENQYYDNPNAIVNNNPYYPKNMTQVYSNRVTPGVTNNKPFQGITFRNQTPNVQTTMPMYQVPDERIYSSGKESYRFNYNKY
jgi:hypothetical protein